MNSQRESLDGTVRHRSTLLVPAQRNFQTKIDLPSKRRSSYALKFAVVLFTALMTHTIFYHQSESFSQINAELQSSQTRSSSSVRKGLSQSQSQSHTNGQRERTIHSTDNSRKGNDSNESENTIGEKEETSSSKVDSSEEKGTGLPEVKSTSEKTHSSESNKKVDMYFRDPNAAVADWNYYPPSKRKPRRDVSWTQAGKSTTALFPLKKKECDLFMDNIDTSPPPLREASNQACYGYDGVLHIQHFDKGGASGTAFFLLNIGMLAWADQHNYLPWIHIEDNFTEPIWDPIVHTKTTNAISFTMIDKMDIGWARDPDDSEWHIFPGKPFRKKSRPRDKTFVLDGTGVWEHYFLPINDFVPGDLSCRHKPIVKMDEDLIVPGIHSNAPWSPRAWRFVAAPYLSRSDLNWDAWFKPQRKRGAEMTERYIRFNPMMERRAHCAFPNSEFSLGMHIRHGDKYIERKIIETDRFLVFAKAFVSNGGGSIYVATDSAKVVESILENWPKYVVDHVVYQPSVLGRTSDKTAAFNLGISPHRTNVEALTDVLALSKSTFFLHGLSAMSEAVFYLNPGLGARSMNLEDEMYREYNSEYFVKTIMPLGK